MITFGDISYKTNFDIQGFDRRWNWGSRNPGGFGYLNYAFIIGPKLVGFYFDFTDASAEDPARKSKATYTCKRR